MQWAKNKKDEFVEAKENWKNCITGMKTLYKSHQLRSRSVEVR